MGRPRPLHCRDHAETLVEGMFDGAGKGCPVLVHGRFNLTTWETDRARIALQRSFDGGHSWHAFGQPILAGRSYIVHEPERGVWWRLCCERLDPAAPLLRYRFSQ